MLFVFEVSLRNIEKVDDHKIDTKAIADELQDVLQFAQFQGKIPGSEVIVQTIDLNPDQP